MHVRSFFFCSLLLVCLAGCGPSVDDLCERQGECTGATAEDVAECKDEGGELRDNAEAAGCGGEFDDYLSCLDGLDICNLDEQDTACQAEAFALFGCGDQGQPDPPAPG